MRTRRASQTPGRFGTIHEGDPIIAPFPPISLTTTRFQWLHPETWNDREFDFFLQNRQLFASQSQRRIPPFSNPKRTQTALAARFILKGEDLISAVEVQGFHQLYHRYHLLLGDHPTNWQDSSEELSILVTAVIFVGEGDRITIVPPNKEAAAAIAKYQFGSPIQVFEPSPDPMSASAGRTLEVISIDPEAFFQTPLGNQSRQTLAYLEKRLHRMRDAEASTKKRPRKKRGLLSRLFGR